MRKKQPPVREQGFPPVCAHRRVRLMTFLPSLRPAVRKRSRCRLPALLSCRPHGGARVSFCPLQVWLRGREQQESPQQRGPLPVRAQEKKRPGPSPYHGPPSGRTTLPYPEERENHPNHRPRAAPPDRRPMTTGRIPQPDDPLRQPVPPHPWGVPQAVAPVPALWSDRLPPRMRAWLQQPSCGRARRMQAGCPTRETPLRPAAGWGSPASGTAASASAACRTAKDPSTGGAICATASATGTGPSSATGAAFGLPARRRLGELFAAAGVASGAGAAGAAAATGAADGTDSGKATAGTVSVPRAAVRADDASLSGGAGKSSQSSSPGSTTRPPPDDDRPYSAARRSASAASAAASMGRSTGCCSGTGAVVGPASPADAGVVAAAFLRPRPPEVEARPARETALRRAPE